MIGAAFGFAGYAVLSLTATPLLLALRTWTIDRPRLALLAWYFSFLTGVAAATTSLALVVVEASTLDAGVIAADLGDLGLPTAGAWLGLGAMGVILASVIERHLAMVRRERATDRRLRDLLDSGACEIQHRDGLTIAVVQANRAFACAVPGGGVDILVTSKAVSVLSHAELRAVIEHEHVHLRQRHSLAVRIAELNIACLPATFPAPAGLKRSTALLIELIADDVAARRHGQQTLAGALRTIGTIEHDEAMLLRADRVSSPT